MNSQKGNQLPANTQRFPPPRRYRRMYNYNQKQAAHLETSPLGDWGDEMLVEDRFSNLQMKPSPTAPSTAYKTRGGKQVPVTAVPDPNKYRATESTQPLNERQYTDVGMTSQMPNYNYYRQNFDFSGLYTIMISLYNECTVRDPRLPRELPFCLFQHAIVNILWLYIFVKFVQNIFENLKFSNKDRRFSSASQIVGRLPENMCIPGPISEYIRQFTDNLMPDGDRIQMNIPESCLPKGPVGDIAAGTFGAIHQDGSNHNLYECCWSPYVTARFIEACRDNPANAEWNPLPDGYFPERGVPNENLLGYHRTERLHPESLQIVNTTLNYMDNSDDISGRIRFSRDLIERFSGVVQKHSNNIICTTGIISLKPQNICAFVETIPPVPFDKSLADATTTVQSAYTASAATAGQIIIHRQRRRRNPNAPGFCFTINGAGRPLWMEHINKNFDMEGQFGPFDLVRLRSHNESKYNGACPTDGVRKLVGDWITRSYTAHTVMK